VIHTPQSPAALASVEALALTMDDFTLAGVAYGAGLLGSTVLALALRAGKVTGRKALDLSRLEEIFQAETWGQDAEAPAPRPWRSRLRSAEAEDWRSRRLQVLESARWFAALRLR
jgi:chaperone required for assembly of F1-ATPase